MNLPTRTVALDGASVSELIDVGLDEAAAVADRLGGGELREHAIRGAPPTHRRQTLEYSWYTVRGSGVEEFSMPANPTEAIAAYVAGLTYDALGGTVQQRVKEITLDTLASAIAGRHGDETAQIEGVAEAIFGSGTATVLGGTSRLSPAGATLVNGYQVTAVTVCDIFRPALCHVTPQVIPPAMAVTQQRGATGREFLTAVAAGLEVTARVGYALNYPAFRDRGWHAPGVIGPFGGAAAAGHLLDLDVVRQRNAFALAGSQSAGTFAHWGTPTIKFHQSRGALSGLMAATLAEQGFRSADDILTNPDGGLLSTYSDGGRPDALTDGLGERWDLQDIALRRWPAASLLQTMITSLLALSDQHDIDAKEIAEVRVALSETVHGMHGNLPWQDRFRAQLSAPYLAAVMQHDRAPGFLFAWTGRCRTARSPRAG